MPAWEMAALLSGHHDFPEEKYHPGPRF